MEIQEMNGTVENVKEEGKTTPKGGTTIEEKGSTWLQFMAACSATLSYFVGGCFLGWTSPALPQLQAEDSFFPITSAQGSWVASFLSLGVMFAPLPAGYIADVMGRKPLLLFVALPSLVYWIMVVFTRNIGVLYTSRFIAGFSLGIAATICPLYVGEIAEDRIRGTIATIFQVQLNLGTLFEYAVGPYVSYANLAIISMIFPVFLFISFIWMPETPYYLLAKNRRDDAENCLMKLRRKKSPESVEEELDKIKKFVEAEVRDRGSFRNLFESWRKTKLLCIVLGLLAFQNFSGIIPILSYISIILDNCGSSNCSRAASMDNDLSSIVFGSVLLVVSVLCSALVDRAGRRPLLLISAMGCAITLAAEGLYLFLDDKGHFDDTTAFEWMPLTFLLLFTITYSLGLGPLPWAVAGEVFPSNVKSLAIGLVSIGNGVFAFIATKLFQIMNDSVGLFLPFWVFAGCCVVGSIFIALLIPETKGKSFQQINEEMNTGGTSEKKSEGKG